MLSLILPPLPTVLAGWPAYALFYLLGFGLAGGMLLREGWRRHFPLRPWLLLVASTVLALIAGTRLIAGGPADWLTIFSVGHWGAGGPVGRSVLGGMVAAALAVAVLRRVLGFGRDAADAFALPFVLGLAVQGVGCLLAGCCFGELLGTGAGLGIAYGPGTEPFQVQVAQGLLPGTAAQSLPVHAAQLYQILLCLSIAGVLLLMRRGLAGRPGRALPLAFGLYAAGRFGLEFLRDPLGDVVGSGLWLGLKPVQWGLLGAALALAAVMTWRNRQPMAKPTTAPADQPLTNLLVLLALLVLPALLPGHITTAETLIIRALLLPVLLLEGLRWLRALRRAGPLPAALLVAGFGLMSQAPAPVKTPPSPMDEPNQSLTFGLGGLTGSSYQLYENYSTCSTPRQNITGLPGYHQRFAGATLGAAFTQRVGRNHANQLTVGLNGFVGRTSFDPAAVVIRSYNGYDSTINQAATHRALYDINPYAEYYVPGINRSIHFRVGIGFHLGPNYAYDYATSPLRSRPFSPSLMYEIGYKQIIWLHSSIFNGSDAVGNGLLRFGLGTGFGGNKVTLLGGIAEANSNTPDSWNLLGGTVYEAPNSTFGELHWQVSPTWQVEGSGLSNFNDVTRFSLGARYRLPLAGKAKAE